MLRRRPSSDRPRPTTSQTRPHRRLCEPNSCDMSSSLTVEDFQSLLERLDLFLARRGALGECLALVQALRLELVKVAVGGQELVLRKLHVRDVLLQLGLCVDLVALGECL